MLPAALVASLAAMLALQFVLVPLDQPELDAVHPTARIRPMATPTIATAIAEPVIQERPIFTPARANGSGAAGDPLGGAQVSGAWSVGRQTNLVLRQADGTTQTIHIGQAVNEWVFAATTPEGARFSRDGKTIVVPFGASAPRNAPPQDKQTEEEDQ